MWRPRSKASPSLTSNRISTAGEGGREGEEKEREGERERKSLGIQEEHAGVGRANHLVPEIGAQGFHTSSFLVRG